MKYAVSTVQEARRDGLETPWKSQAYDIIASGGDDEKIISEFSERNSREKSMAIGNGRSTGVQRSVRMNQPKLTAARLDAILSPNLGESRSALAKESLWGPKQIGAFMGLSPDTVRRMAKTDPTFPARIRFGRLFVTRTEIVVWLQPRHDEVPQSA